MLTGDIHHGGAGSDGFGLVMAFTLTTFLSALLLFSIQPMFAKMVLSLLGGSPSVWAVALCFFQGALLAGYCYAHLLMRYVPAGYAGIVHLVVFALALVTLPIGLPGGGWREPPTGDPALWQLGLFTVAIGLPFLAVSANAPLLQAWFARTGHPAGHDPYFLYGASNLGSFVALLAYPLVLEPAFGLTSLSRQWTIGFVVLGLAIAVCFWLMRQRLTSSALDVAVPSPVHPNGSDRPTWVQRAGWVGLALVPSALLTAFTAHVATDVASAPLIWVIPLSLYLLTFVVVFREQPLALVPCVLAVAVGTWVFAEWLAGLAGVVLPNTALAGLAVAGGTVAAWLYLKGGISPFRWLLAIQLAAVVLTLLQISKTDSDAWLLAAGMGMFAFFFSSLVAHRTLYEARPAVRYLTEFYLWMSLGGVLGGLFAALIAPRLFSEVFEYPILLALTMACRPGALNIAWHDRGEQQKLWVLAALGLLLVWWVDLSGLAHDVHGMADWLSQNVTLLSIGTGLANALLWAGHHGFATVLTVVFAVLLVVWYARPPRQLVAAGLMCLAVVLLPSSVKQGEAQRSYFGVYRVYQTPDGSYRILMHGTTLHGAQRLTPPAGKEDERPVPATYYYPGSPMARTIEFVRGRLANEGRKGKYGVVGLGTGSLACFAQDAERWRFFEIDPVIVSIARDESKFTFVSKCQPQLDVVLGDARLTMAHEPEGSYDLIIVDAFSSDAIPVHLLTADAIRMYMSRLAPDGILLLHISNRYLDLDSVLAATRPLVPGVEGLLLDDDEADGSYASTGSTVGLFAKNSKLLPPLRALAMAKELPDTSMRGWTDDYSDILSPFLSRLTPYTSSD
ncbi:MAG: fused MFS/spermidine synthase [Hyphomicrobiaceae bacterium]